MEFVDKESIVQWWHFIRVQIWRRRIPDSCVQNNIDNRQKSSSEEFYFSLFSQKSGPNNRWNQKDETGNISKTNSIKIGKILATIYNMIHRILHLCLWRNLHWFRMWRCSPARDKSDICVRRAEMMMPSLHVHRGFKAETYLSCTVTM